MADMINAIGRRKEAVCRVFIKPGSGKWDVNGRTLGDYFPRPALVTAIQQAFVATDTLGRYDVKANVDGSEGSPQIAALAILVLSALREVDAAFEVANGFLLDRGAVIVRPRPDPKLPRINNPGWRNTFGLFTPPTRAMRLDSRFKPLAEGLGLAEYWRKRGIGPDAFLFSN